MTCWAILLLYKYIYPGSHDLFLTLRCVIKRGPEHPHVHQILATFDDTGTSIDQKIATFDDT